MNGVSKWRRLNVRDLNFSYITEYNMDCGHNECALKFRNYGRLQLAAHYGKYIGA